MLVEGDGAMRIAEWLTYTGIEQLKELNRFYGLESNLHSKHELICTLLRQINRKTKLKEVMDQLTISENRFLQLIMLDHSPSYTMEELIGKGRAALQDLEGEPRSLVVQAIKRGWLFPGFSPGTRDLFFVPIDIREQLLQLLIAPYQQYSLNHEPDVYRTEEGLLWRDLLQFLIFVQKEMVKRAQDGAIYKQQQKQLFHSFAIQEQPLHKKGPRFGFGRSYHLYPDRFSLIYDYAFYQQYIYENMDETLCLTEKGQGKCIHIDSSEAQEMYRFWIRLYRRPIHNLPIIIRWIGFLTKQNWMPLDQVYQVVEQWIRDYYYETKRSLFRKVIQMMLHVGVIKLGKKNEQSFICLTPSGRKWVDGISAFEEQMIEEDFLHQAGNK